MILWWMGQHSIHKATPARVRLYHFDQPVTFQGLSVHICTLETTMLTFIQGSYEQKGSPVLISSQPLVDGQVGMLAAGRIYAELAE